MAYHTHNTYNVIIDSHSQFYTSGQSHPGIGVSDHACDTNALCPPNSWIPLRWPEPEAPLCWGTEFCFLIWPFLIIFFVELLRSQSKKHENLPLFGYTFPWILIELYRHIGYMTVGAMTCFLFTDLSKFRIGRLRPHFLTICKPDYQCICKDGDDFEKFAIGEDTEICIGLTSNETTPKMLKEAHLSFMSGHSSLSFYCATFLILYLQARLNKFPESTSGVVNILRQMLKVLRPFMQFGFFILSFWIALTRISDYFHHALDVAMGSLVGIVFAIGTVSAADILKKQTLFWKTLVGDLITEKRKDSREHSKPSSMTFEDYIRYVTEYCIFLNQVNMIIKFQIIKYLTHNVKEIVDNVPDLIF